MSTYLPRPLQKSNELTLINCLAHGALAPWQNGEATRNGHLLPLQLPVFLDSLDSSFVIAGAGGMRQRSVHTPLRSCWRDGSLTKQLHQRMSHVTAT